MFKYVGSPVVPLVAAAGLSACSSLPGQSNGSRSPIEIFEVRNAQGTTSRIASVYSDRFDAFMKERIAKNGGKNRYDYGKDEWLKVELQKILNNGGFDIWWSTYLTRMIIDTYDPQTYNGNKAPLYLSSNGKDIGPVANLSAKENLNIAKTPEVSAKCLIAHLSETHKGEAWTRSLLQLGDAGRSINFPYEFKDEFATFVHLHEIAHCMGANEQMADKISAKIMLKDSTNIEKTLMFLELFKSIRIASAVFNNIHPIYYASFLSIDEAIEDFKTRGAVPESLEYIWSMALERYRPHTTQVAIAVHAVKFQKSLVATCDYTGMAKFISSEIIDETSDDTQKKILKKMAQSFFFLGAHIDEPPKPRGSAPAP